MTSMLRKAAIGASAALTLGASITATATPSLAQGWHGWQAVGTADGTAAMAGTGAAGAGRSRRA